MAYNGFAEPDAGILKLVDQTLKDSHFSGTILEKIRSIAKKKYTQEHHKNIDTLKVYEVIFQSSEFILIQLFGPNDVEPFWFAEVHGSEIFVGFDT